MGTLKKVKKVFRKAASRVEQKASRKGRDSESSSSESADSRHRRKRRKGDLEGENSDGSRDQYRRGHSPRKKREDSSSEDSEDKRAVERKKKRKTLQKRALDVNCVDYDRWTPLHHASHGGALDVVEYLLKLHAKVDVPNALGNTPLHLAAKRGHAKIIAALRKAGADMGRKNSKGEAPADLVRGKLQEIHAKSLAAKFDERLQDEQDGWGVWGDETEDAREAGFGSRSTKGWDWFGEERAHRAGLHHGHSGDDDKDDLEPEDAWKDEVAEEMARKRRKQQQDAEEAFLENARREWEEMKRKKAAKEEESRRILEEEQRKDSAWRKSVAAGGLTKTRKKYEAAWAAFSTSYNVGITLQDIPFPVKPGQESSLKDLLLEGVPPEEHRKRIREEVLRWHPDKFLQKFGKRILEKDKDSMLLRVKETSQAIQDVYFSLGKDAK